MILSTPNTILPSEATNSETQISNDIKNLKSGKAQLKKVSTEFESLFVTKMLDLMGKTVDKEGGVFSEGQYLQTFKSFVFNEMGREIANNPRTSFGFATQIYNQMEKFVQE